MAKVSFEQGLGARLQVGILNALCEPRLVRGGVCVLLRNTEALAERSALPYLQDGK